MAKLDLSKLGSRGLGEVRIEKEESARTTLALDKQTRADLEKLTQYYDCTLKEYAKRRLEVSTEKDKKSRDPKWRFSEGFAALFDAWKKNVSEDTDEAKERKTFVLDREIIERLNDISNVHGAPREDIVGFFATIDMALSMQKLRAKKAYFDWYRGELDELRKQVNALVDGLQARAQKHLSEMKLDQEDVDLGNYSEGSSGRGGVDIIRIAIECDMVDESLDIAIEETESELSILKGERDDE